MEWTGKRFFSRLAWILGIICLCTGILFIKLFFTTYGEEWDAIQCIANNIDNYEAEIERWGYQVNVFDPMSGNMSKEDDFALINYMEGVYDPVLILTDQAGGCWYFYNGFDQYAQEMESIELTPLWGGEEDIVKIVTQFQLFKDCLNCPPLEKNNARPDERAYYDVQVHLNVSYYTMEAGERVFGPEADISFTNYSSNNFEDCRHFGGVDPSGLNYDSDREIKERFTAEQLLEFYQQGLTLQERLIELYHSNS